MTGAAIGYPFNRKLAFVFVLMASNTFEMYAGILHRQRGGVIGTHMTFFARHACVLALQRKMSLVVREEELLPRFGAVAGFTSIRHLFCELPFMDILMTGSALQCSIPMKLPRTLGIHFLSMVACHAGNRRVRTEQCKACLRVIVYGETHEEKIGFGVARLALSAIGAFGKLSRMRIGMAIRTALEFRNVKSEFPARIFLFLIILMAILTFQYGMFSFQRKLCRLMVENGFGDGMKIFRCMARCALLREFPFVRILVARVTRSKFHMDVADRLAVFESWFMTTLTFNSCMLAGKPVARVAVGKFLRRLPLFNRMT